MNRRRKTFKEENTQNMMSMFNTDCLFKRCSTKLAIEDDDKIYGERKMASGD